MSNKKESTGETVLRNTVLYAVAGDGLATFAQQYLIVQPQVLQG